MAFEALLSFHCQTSTAASLGVACIDYIVTGIGCSITYSFDPGDTDSKRAYVGSRILKETSDTALCFEVYLLLTPLTDSH